MPHREASTFSKRVTILIGLGVVGALAFDLAISFYRNILFEETVAALTKRNRELRENIDRGLEELAYYGSAQYRDKYAKENLGRLNAGEKVLILTPEPPPLLPPEDTLSQQEQREAAYQQYLQKIPTIEHWQLYLFAPEELARMKQSF